MIESIDRMIDAWKNAMGKRFPDEGLLRYRNFGVVNRTLTHYFGRPDRKLFLNSVPIFPWIDVNKLAFCITFVMAHKLI